MSKILLLLWLFFISDYSLAQAKNNRTNLSPVTYALWNLNTNEFIAGSNDGEIRPVASITKLMSVLVTIRENLDLDEELIVTGKERSNLLRNGMRIARGKLIELALISSDNLATRTLAETYPGGYNTFIDRMNSTAEELGMIHTRYEDATGLLGGNISSASDIRKLVQAVSPFSIITNAANTAKVAIQTTISNKNKAKTVTIEGFNTNIFVGKLDIIAAKTGYTSKAGRCLTMLFRHYNNEYLLVIMGAVNNKQRQQFVEYLLTKI